MTTAELIARFPEFTTETTARLQLALDDAELMVGQCFGKFRTLGVAYMAAHLFTLQKSTSTGDTSPISVVTSEAVGSVSISYASQTINNRSENSGTLYGKYYDDLKKRYCFGSVLIG